MLTLHVEAETLSELQREVLRQMGFLTQTIGTPIAPAAEIAEVEPEIEVPQSEGQKRTRRTKAQMAEDAAAAQGTSQAGDQDHPEQPSQEDGSDSGQTATTDASRYEGGPPTEADLADENHPYNATVKPAVLKLSQKGGRPAVEALLAPYAVGNAREIPVSGYRQLLAEIAAAMEA